MITLLLPFIVSIIVCMCISPFVLSLCRKLGARQTILHYVKDHEGKNGTPTMGGLAFIFTCLVCSIVFAVKDIFVFMPVILMLAFAILGFMDDFIKVRTHKNEGLLPYQKIIGQAGIGFIFAIYVFFKCGTSINFFNINIDLGFFIIPFVFFVVIATTNSVNLTDGLDGLAGGVSAIFCLFVSIILCILNQNELAVISIIMSGSLLGFLVLNMYPAKIFMGDVGSLAIGGFISGLCSASGLEFLIVTIGFMFVLSAISDILQVVYFKRTKTRLFLMAPLHHHFQKKGLHENKITVVYIVITIILGCISTLLYLI